MAKNLKKFVNPRFTQTVGLKPMRRLLERHRAALIGFDFGVFDDDQAAREAIQDFFAGSEDNYPKGLVADLHAIAELGNACGLRLLLEQARLQKANIAALVRPAEQDPKHIALAAFLEHLKVFEAAADMLAIFRPSSIAEFQGVGDGQEPNLDPETRDAFERAAGKMFEADLHGHYCRVRWYEDGDEISLVVAHGEPISTTQIVEDGAERVISYRATRHATLSYSATAGRLKIGGVAKSRRRELAEIFARTILRHPDFFLKNSAQDLYTLEQIERAWPKFAVSHKFDPLIRRVQVIEVQANRVALDLLGEPVGIDWSILAHDNDDCALGRLHEMCGAIEFRSGTWQLGHVLLRVYIDTGGKKCARVAVKVWPKTQVIFKRHRFEGLIMDLLRRNGFCRDQAADHPALAAE